MEELPHKQTGIEFQGVVQSIMLSKLDSLLNLQHQITVDGFQYIRNGQQLLELKFELKDEDEMKFQYVEIEFTNPVISLNLKIEKTLMEGYVADYMMFYASNAVISIQQTILNIDDIYGDMEQMLGYVCEKSRNARPLIFTKYKGKPKPKPEERRLKLLATHHNNIEKSLQNKPILSAIRMLPLNLKKNKIISTKAGVLDYISNLEMPKIPRYEPRERQLILGPDEAAELRKDHPTLKPGHSHFMVNKLSSFTSENIDNRDNLFLGVGTVERVSDKEIRFPLYTSRSNSMDMMGYLKVNGPSQPIEFIITSPSFIIIMKIYVPTVRFTVKNSRMVIERTVNVVQILDHLNELRVWRDFFPGERKHQWRVEELIQPSIIYMMYREMFDNMSDGQTAQANPEDEGILHYSHTVTDNGESGLWEFNVYTDTQHVLYDAITFKEMGEDFPTAYMTGEMFLADDPDHGIFFGNREVPEKSMFNQHFLLKKYMELQVEFIIRSSGQFLDYKDDITPFITDAYKYISLYDAPPVKNPDPRKGLRGYKYSSDIVGANKLEVKVPGDVIRYKLCAVLSTEYHDNIQLTEDGYIFTGGRFYFRKDVDYCYEVINAPTQDDDELTEENGENDDRRLKEVSSGQLV